MEEHSHSSVKEPLNHINTAYLNQEWRTDKQSKLSIPTYVVIYLFWPFIKISSFYQHSSAFWIGLSFVVIELWMIAGYHPIIFNFYFLIIYFGMVHADIQGVKFLRKMNTLREAILCLRHHSCWENIQPEEYFDDEKRYSTNKKTLIIFIVALIFGICVAIFYYFVFNKNDYSMLDIIDYGIGIISLILLAFSNGIGVNEVKKSYVVMLSDITSFGRISETKDKNYFDQPNAGNGVDTIITINKKIIFWKKFSYSLKPMEISQSIGLIWVILVIILYNFTYLDWEFVDSIVDFIDVDNYQVVESSFLILLGFLMIYFKVKFTYHINEIHEEFEETNHKLNAELKYLYKFSTVFRSADQEQLKNLFDSLGVRQELFNLVDKAVKKDPKWEEYTARKRDKRFINYCKKLVEINDLVDASYNVFYTRIEYKLLGIFSVNKNFFYKLLFGILVPGISLLIHILSLLEAS